MGVWRVPAEVLAQARFTISPMADVVAALGQLTRDDRRTDRAFVAAHGESFARMLDAHPGRRAVVDHCIRPGWLADFMAIPPPAAHPGFEEELDLVTRLGDRRIRDDLRWSTPSRLPRILLRPGVTEYAVGLLQWLWTHTVETDWPRRSRVLHADIVARSTRLSAHGWVGVVHDLGRPHEWIPPGEMRISRAENSPLRTLPEDATLFFIPTHSYASWVGWQLPDRYAVFYPVSGALAPTQGAPVDALDRLVGTARASILRLLERPGGPTSLAAWIGLPVGAVGNHLRILLDSGLVLRRRSGREVLYWRTALADGLVAATTPRKDAEISRIRR